MLKRSEENLFEELRERLLAGGIAPRHVRRTIAELQDHLADLRAHGAEESVARARLGSVDEIAQSILARPELKSWTARAPWLTLVIGPIAALALVSAALFLAWVCVLLTIRPPGGIRVIEPMWFQSLTHAATAALVYVAPVLIGWGALRLAQERRVALLWPVLGLTVFALLSGAFEVSVLFPTAAGERGELRVGFGWAPPFADLSKSSVHAVVNMALMLGPVLVLSRMRRGARRFG